MTRPHRKPRLMIAGEFSTGKTRLINGLLGEDLLPCNVTATLLPPVWLSADHTADHCMDITGLRHPLSSLEEMPIADTAYCALIHDAPILEHFDLIDTPGNSDPNMDPVSWQRMLDCADVVVWCSNAVQAWRQSEKAVWQEMPARLRSNATLVISHADRLLDDRSAARLTRRIAREAKPFFDFQVLASLVIPEDVAIIADHLVELAGQIPLSGVDHPVFAPGAPAAQHAPAPQTSARMRDLRENVVPLFETVRRRSRAQALWREITAGQPPQTSEEWAARMQGFLAAVDAEFEKMDRAHSRIAADMRNATKS